MNYDEACNIGNIYKINIFLVVVHQPYYILLLTRVHTVVQFYCTSNIWVLNIDNRHVVKRYDNDYRQYIFRLSRLNAHISICRWVNLLWLMNKHIRHLCSSLKMFSLLSDARRHAKGVSSISTTLIIEILWILNDDRNAWSTNVIHSLPVISAFRWKSIVYYSIVFRLYGQVSIFVFIKFMWRFKENVKVKKIDKKHWDKLIISI